MPDSGPIIIIRNPAAGQRKGPFIDRVIEKLVQANADVVLLETKAAGHATALAREIIEKHSGSIVAAAGGDGTIREVAMGIIGTEARLGIIPAGTANVLARDLGYMFRKSFSASRTAEILLTGMESSLHPFHVEFENREMLGLCWLGAGFDAEVLAHVNLHLKKMLGRSAFVPSTLKALAREPGQASIPYQHGNNPALKVGWAVLANIQRYAGPFTITKQTKATSSNLACMMFKSAGRWARIVDQAQIAFTSLDSRADVFDLDGSVLELGDSDTPIQLDGDYLGKGPVTVRKGAHSLTVKCLS